MAFRTLIQVESAEAAKWPFDGQPNDFAIEIATPDGVDHENSVVIRMRAVNATGNANLRLPVGDQIRINDDIYTLADDAVFKPANERIILPRAWLIRGFANGNDIDETDWFVASRQWANLKSSANSTLPEVLASVDKLNAYAGLPAVAAFQINNRTVFADTIKQLVGIWAVETFSPFRAVINDSQDVFRVGQNQAISDIDNEPVTARTNISLPARRIVDASPFQFVEAVREDEDRLVVIAFAFDVPAYETLFEFTQPMRIDYLASSSIAYVQPDVGLRDVWARFLDEVTSEALVEGPLGTTVVLQQQGRWEIRIEDLAFVEPGKQLISQNPTRTYTIQSVDKGDSKTAVVTASVQVESS